VEIRSIFILGKSKGARWEDTMALRCTDHLIQEHRLILRAVYVLQAMADQASDLRMPEAEDVENLLRFFRRFADDHHQGKEEAVLFPALRTGDPAATKGPLGQMIFEHEQERSLVEGLEDALRTRKHEDFAYYGNRMAKILSNHIYKEDNILFDLVEKTITSEVDERLAEEMVHFDQSMRPGIYAELVHTLNQLERKYLGKAA
jgi:hemerythrin-like domain-containing protein